MSKPFYIPVWELNEMRDHLFGTSHNALFSSTAHHLFHINKIEVYKDKIHFPLPPHRKQVYDFLF